MAGFSTPRSLTADEYVGHLSISPYCSSLFALCSVMLANLFPVMKVLNLCNDQWPCPPLILATAHQDEMSSELRLRSRSARPRPTSFNFQTENLSSCRDRAQNAEASGWFRDNAWHHPWPSVAFTSD